MALKDTTREHGIEEGADGIYGIVERLGRDVVRLAARDKCLASLDDPVDASRGKPPVHLVDRNLANHALRLEPRGPRARPDRLRIERQSWLSTHGVGPRELCHAGALRPPAARDEPPRHTARGRE